jgi:hypothetical protein
MLNIMPYTLKYARVAMTSIIMAVPLSSCTFVASLFEPAQEAPLKPAPIPAAKITGMDYAGHITMARLAMDAAPETEAELAPHLAAIKKYAKQKPGKGEKLTLVILEYKSHDHQGTHQVVAAVDRDKDDFSLLEKIMVRLHGMDKRNGSALILQNIRVVATKVSPSRTLAVPRKQDTVAEFLDSLQQYLMKERQGLTARDTIELQLSLIEFFTARQFQDAAYLSFDNAKRLLADAGHDQTLDPDTLKAFSQRLEMLEGKLKEQLPYRL